MYGIFKAVRDGQLLKALSYERSHIIIIQFQQTKRRIIPSSAAVIDSVFHKILVYMTDRLSQWSQEQDSDTQNNYSLAGEFNCSKICERNRDRIFFVKVLFTQIPPH